MFNKKLLKVKALAPMSSVLLLTAVVGSPAFAGDKYAKNTSAETHRSEKTASEYWGEFKHDANESWENTGEAFRDGWLESKLETAIVFSKHLNPFDIDIEVNGDTAVLEGVVENDIQRELAESVAMGIEGIDDVDNELKVDPEYAYEEKSVDEGRSFSQVLDDAAITAEVKTRYLLEDNVSGIAIDVDTYNGEVTLTGEVDSEIVSDLAESLAKQNDSVKNVVNNLNVQS